MSPAHQPTCLLTGTLPLSPRIDISTGGGDDVIFPHVLIYPFTEHRLWAWHADGIGEEGQGIRRYLLFVEADSVGRALLVGELGEGSSQGSPVAEAPPPHRWRGVLALCQVSRRWHLTFRAVPPVCLLPFLPIRQGWLLCAACS